MLGGSGAKIGGSGAKFGGTVAPTEASGIKIWPLRPGLGALGPISGHQGAMEQRLEDMRQRFGTPGPIVGALA